MARPVRSSLNKRFIQAGSRVTRIKMEQNPYRPVKVRQRSMIRKAELRFSPWWWITHRRGLKRTQLGLDPREMRAVSHDLVKGTLPERIVFRWLTEHYFVSGLDFSFQSSELGGRLEFGGMVVDFLFPAMRLVIQVQGPTHDQYARFRKDEEQRLILEQMGFHVEYLDMDLIYNEPAFEDAMRKIFRLGSYTAGGPQLTGYPIAGDDDYTQDEIDRTQQYADDLLAAVLAHLA